MVLIVFLAVGGAYTQYKIYRDDEEKTDKNKIEEKLLN